MKYELYIAGYGYVGHVNTLSECKRIAASFGVSTIRGIGWIVSKM